MPVKYKPVGFIPDLNCALLRGEGVLEMWVRSPVVTVRSMTVNGCEFEYYRTLEHAWRVVDNDFNRANYPDLIGRIYTDEPPAYVVVKEL